MIGRDERMARGGRPPLPEPPLLYRTLGAPAHPAKSAPRPPRFRGDPGPAHPSGSGVDDWATRGRRTHTQGGARAHGDPWTFGVVAGGMSETPIRVLVADDQTLVREGLVTLLGLLPGVEVAGAARDGEEAIELAARLRPDVVLMDLRMPRMDGVEATRRLAAAEPAARVVVLTTYADDESIFAALQAGALGYLTKDSSADDIARAVRTVHAGQALLEPAVQRRLIESLRGRPPAPAPPLPAPD